jgi:hypothetical protein
MVQIHHFEQESSLQNPMNFTAVLKFSGRSLIFDSNILRGGKSKIDETSISNSISPCLQYNYF